MKQDLFEMLHVRTGARYISDLHFSPFREEAIRLAQSIPDSDYSKAEWEDLCNYLSIDASCFDKKAK